MFIGWLVAAAAGLATPVRSDDGGSAKEHMVAKHDGEGDHDEADRDDGPESARRAVVEGRAAPLRELLEIVRRRYPGEVVGVKLRAEGESLVYRVRILEHGGRLITVGIDAVSRRIVGLGES